MFLQPYQNLLFLSHHFDDSLRLPMAQEVMFQHSQLLIEISSFFKMSLHSPTGVDKTGIPKLIASRKECGNPS